MSFGRSLWRRCSRRLRPVSSECDNTTSMAESGGLCVHDAAYRCLQVGDHGHHSTLLIVFVLYSSLFYLLDRVTSLCSCVRSAEVAGWSRQLSNWEWWEWNDVSVDASTAVGHWWQHPSGASSVTWMRTETCLLDSSWFIKVTWSCTNLLLCLILLRNMRPKFGWLVTWPCEAPWSLHFWGYLSHCFRLSRP